MYLILIFFTAIVFSFLGYRQSKTLFNPIMIFNTWWLICITIAYINPYALFPVTNEAYLYFFLGMLSFDIASVLTLSLPHKKKSIEFFNNKIKETFKKKEINTKLFLEIQWILVIVILPYAIKAINRFIAYGWMGMRGGGTASDPLFHSTVEIQIYRNLLVLPCYFSCTVLASILFASGKLKIRQMIPTLILVIFQVFITSGRLDQYRFIIFMVFAFGCCRNIENNKKIVKKVKNNKRFLVVLLIAIIALAINVSGVRSLTIENDLLSQSIKTMIIYLTGSLHYFSITLSNPDSYGLNGPLFYGMGFIGSIWDTFATFCSFFLHIKIATSSDVTFYIDSPNYIGNGIYYNAFPTMYYIFIRDLGPIGVILETSIFSIICSKIFLWFKMKKNTISLSFYIIFIYLMINSVLWWELKRVELLFAILHLCWIVPLIEKKSNSKFKGEDI